MSLFHINTYMLYIPSFYLQVPSFKSFMLILEPVSDADQFTDADHH